MIPVQLVTVVDKATGHHIRIHPDLAATDKDRYQVVKAAPTYDVNGRLLPAKPTLKTKTATQKKEG